MRPRKGKNVKLWRLITLRPSSRGLFLYQFQAYWSQLGCFQLAVLGLARLADLGQCTCINTFSPFLVNP